MACSTRHSTHHDGILIDAPCALLTAVLPTFCEFREDQQQQSAGISGRRLFASRCERDRLAIVSERLASTMAVNVSARTSPVPWPRFSAMPWTRRSAVSTTVHWMHPRSTVARSACDASRGRGGLCIVADASGSASRTIEHDFYSCRDTLTSIAICLRSSRKRGSTSFPKSGSEGVTPVAVTVAQSSCVSSCAARGMTSLSSAAR